MQYFINHEEFHIDFMVSAVVLLLLHQVFVTGYRVSACTVQLALLQQPA